MSDIILGIDLGTTNSEVAVIINGKPVVMTDSDNRKLLPSFVGLSQNGELLIGEAARNQYHLFPEQTIKSIKRKMGSSETVTLGKEHYTPQEISAMLLRQLKRNAEQFLGESVSQAVITVPAYFNDAQRQATREAGQIAGLEVVRLLNEPTAAALSYDVHFEGQKTALVCDLGGGTLDISIVRIENGVVEVLASQGLTSLGGDDFDQVIINLIVQHIAHYSNRTVDQLESDGQLTARLWRSAVQAKLALSNQPFVKINEEFLFSEHGIPFNLSMELSRDHYEQAIMPLVMDILDTAQQVLSSADMNISDLDEILLAGGATRTPLVKQLLAAETGIEPTDGLHPDLCVVTGAAMQAGMLAGQTVDSVLVDITPYSFGTRIIGELNGMPYPALFFPVIKRNTPIPVTCSELFYTAQDKQTYIDLKIYQGEDDNALNNTLIGEFRVEGLRKVRYKNPVIVEFSLDANGLLTVKATEKETGLNKQITIQNACPRMQDELIEQARDKLDQLTGTESETGEIEPAISPAFTKRVESARQQATEADIRLIDELMDALLSAHTDHNTESLMRTQKKLEEILYYLES
ncbi:MAG: Hsp70 family protein [Gammaproteobacteria bacterium]|nr:Hsp70 family protein [Gammaproteobacteria bacterium]